MKKIKLLRVVTQAEVVPWHLNNFIKRSKDDFTLFIAGNDVSRYKEEYKEVNFIDFKIQRKISLITDLLSLVQLIKICLEVKPDVIHSIMPKSGLLAAISGFVVCVPVRIHTYTGQIWSTKKGLSRWCLKVLDKIIFKLNTKCLTDSPSQSDFLAINRFLKNNQQIPFLGKGSLTGVDLNQYDIKLLKNKTEKRKTLGLKEDDFVYGFFARKSISKGVVKLIESFSKISHLPKTKLILVGHDESEGELDRILEKHANLREQIININQADNHEECLSVIDILCSPSSSEGFGSIVIEAAALEIPTIGFSVLGLTDSILENETGILVPYNDIELFSQSMKDLYLDKQKLNKLKENARDRVEQNFSADYLYLLQLEFYKSLLKWN